MGGIVVTIKSTEMTEEQFTQIMGVFKKQHASIEADMLKAQNAYIESYPIKEGDKCKDGNGKVCWLKGLRFADVTSTKPDFIVNYAKNDGTRSCRDMYAHTGIVKIEED